MNNQPSLFPINTDPLSSAAPAKWTPRQPVSKPEPTTAVCWDCNGVDPTCKSCHGTQRVPIARVNQIKAKLAADAESPSVRGFVAAGLHGAGPVVVRSGRVEGGMTIQELAEYVSGKRGRHTKETTITQPLKDLREAGFARDSGHSRRGNAGVDCTVFEHTYIITEGASQ